MVDRPRHHRPRALDGALSLPDMARLSAAAKPLDTIGARLADPRPAISPGSGTCTNPPHARAANRLGKMERCDARSAYRRGRANRRSSKRSIMRAQYRRPNLPPGEAPRGMQLEGLTR